LEKITNIKLTN